MKFAIAIVLFFSAVVAEEKPTIDFNAVYANDLIGNPIGGTRQGFANAGNLGLNFNLNLEKLAHMNGCSMIASMASRSGISLTARDIGNQFPVQQLYGGETYRLVELYFKESIFNGHMNLKLGRLCSGNDFFASHTYIRYVLNGICGNPIGIFFNTPFLAYPNATWGVYLDFRPHQHLVSKWGVYNCNPHIVKNKYHGANLTFRSPEGVLLINEWQYRINQEEGDIGLRGSYKIGAYVVTGPKVKYPSGHSHNNYGWYFLFDQMLYQPEQIEKWWRGLTAWGAFLLAPPYKNMFPFFISAGLIYEGLVDSRPLDALCFGFVYGKYSPELRNLELYNKRHSLVSSFGHQRQTSEINLELNYWFSFDDVLLITPVAQYIINPKGYGTIQNAFVIGAQITLRFRGGHLRQPRLGWKGALQGSS
jgi:porin